MVSMTDEKLPSPLEKNAHDHHGYGDLARKA